MLWRVESVTQQDETQLLDDLDKFLMDVLFGFKQHDFEETKEFPARSVLTVIEKTAKRLDVDLMNFYGGLSEQAHPNYLGMLSLYQAELDPRTCWFRSQVAMRIVVFQEWRQ